MATYNITSWTDLTNVRNDVHGIYTLTAHLNMNTAGYWGVGSNFTPIPSFYGTINGNGFTISDLVINLPTTNNTALISNTQGCTVTNLKILNALVIGQDETAILMADSGTGSSCSDCEVSGTVVGRDTVGGMFAACDSNPTRCKSSATVYGRTIVGGFAAYAGPAKTHTDCCATGDVIAYGTKSGGYSGAGYANHFTRCYASGNVWGVSEVGGFMGYDDYYSGTSVYANCYSTGRVSGGTNTGGFVGFIHGGYTNCYFYYDGYHKASGNVGDNANITQVASIRSFYSSTHPVYSGWSAWFFAGVNELPVINTLQQRWAGTGNYNVSTNWSWNKIPTVGDIVIFDGVLSSSTCTINTPVSLKSIDMAAGTVNQNYTVILSDKFHIEGGTYNLQQPFSIIRAVSESTGGTFNFIPDPGTPTPIYPFTIVDIDWTAGELSGIEEIPLGLLNTATDICFATPDPKDFIEEIPTGSLNTPTDILYFNFDILEELFSPAPPLYPALDMTFGNDNPDLLESYFFIIIGSGERTYTFV